MADEEVHAAVNEFFELFKTPWAFHHDRLRCDVLICSSHEIPSNSAKLVMIYGSTEQAFNQEHGVETKAQRENATLSFGSDRIPIYGKCCSYKEGNPRNLFFENTREAVAVEISDPEKILIRIGYDLFKEIAYVLTRGQPSNFAKVPTLELHIAFIRECILFHSLPIVEIPPIPAGYKFIACLTHDVDHARVRNHKFDHAMLGFLYRALIGSLVDVGRGRKSIGDLMRNWVAAFSLPLVYLGLMRDFWDSFERYLEIEKGVSSTFFVIPAKDDPGMDSDGRADSKRAVRYDAEEISDDLRRLTTAGHEVGVHGIDAWRDPIKGRAELERIRGLTGTTQLGVRMHWLYFGEESHAALEDAGFSYDSTIGYNNAVGYRAGTVQAFKPLGAKHLLELPMHIMDTALFYPSHMDLSPSEARGEIESLVENAVRFGGVLTINWHDRSIAPERLWTDTYVELVENLKRRGAWIPTASEAVSWFRQRRSAQVETEAGATSLRIRVSVKNGDKRMPGLRLRARSNAERQSKEFVVLQSGEFELASTREAVASHPVGL